MFRINSTALRLCSIACIMTFIACSTTPAPSAIDQAIGARDAEAMSRDPARHPAQTLEFFDVQPGMTVAEALPGRGWYTSILANLLGDNGTLYGINYPDKIWPLFSFSTEKMVAERIASTTKFPEMVARFTDNSVQSQGFTFETVPDEINGTVDRVLMIRALHNLNRFESSMGMRSQALAAVHKMLKDDGLVGVVQHRAPADAADSWADGSRGYLKQNALIDAFEAAGFALLRSSEINANPNDKPGPNDIVWRLPPSYNGSKDNPALKAAMTAIGESDRMTLLFRKK